LSVFVIRLNNFSPVFGTGVTTYSILYLIPNDQTNNNKLVGVVAGFEMSQYKFYVNKYSQIGSKIGSVKISSNGIDNFDLKINTNQNLPFKCSFNRNQSAIEILVIDYLIQTHFLFEIQIGNNKTNVSVLVYSNSDFNIRNFNEINVNITNDEDLVFTRRLEIYNPSVDYKLSMLTDEVFDLVDNILTLNKAKFQIFLSNYRPNLVNLAEYCLVNGNLLRIPLELVISITSSIDQNILNINSVLLNLLITCEYIMSLPQLTNLDVVQFALENYEVKINKKLNSSMNLINLHYYPENYINKKGYNTKFYIQNSPLFSIDLNQAIVKTDTTFNLENYTNQQYNFQVFGAIQSNNEVMKSISTKFQINIADIDDHKPSLSIEKSIVYIFANSSISSLITKLIGSDGDSGACGRTLFYLYKPSNFITKYFRLNRFTGELMVKSSLNKLYLNNEDDEIIQNSLLLSNSLLIELFIEVNSGLPNSLFTRAKLQIFIDYNCQNCIYYIKSANNSSTFTTTVQQTVNKTEATTSSFLSSTWSIVLICIFGITALLLAVLLVALKLRNNYKRNAITVRNGKPNTSKQTSESSLFYNSSNASTCSHISDKSVLSFSKKNDEANIPEDRQLKINDTLSNQSTLFTSNSFSENKNELLKKLTIPLSSTISGGSSSSDDRLQYLHPIRTPDRTKSHFQEYLTRLGIQQPNVMANSEENLLKSKSPSILTTSISDLPRPQQHYYFNYQESNENFDDIDNVMVDLKQLVGVENLANIDIQSIEDYVKMNRLRATNLQQKYSMTTNSVILTNSNTLATTTSSDAGSYNNSTIGSNFNDDELSFQKWDTLLDWTPQYAPLSNIFEDLTRLNTETQQQQQAKNNNKKQLDDDDVTSPNKLFLKNSLLDSSKINNKNSDYDYQYCFNDEENDSEI
jgi:hypothetical protein